VQERWERGRELKERDRVVGKAAGDECVFIPAEGTELADGGSVRTPYQTRRAVREAIGNRFSVASPDVSKAGIGIRRKPFRAQIRSR
jgi:hypothetical protein